MTVTLLTPWNVGRSQAASAWPDSWRAICAFRSNGVRIHSIRPRRYASARRIGMPDLLRSDDGKRKDPASSPAEAGRAGQRSALPGHRTQDEARDGIGGSDDDRADDGARDQ